MVEPVLIEDASQRQRSRASMMKAVLARRPWLPALALVVIAFVVYLPALHNGFIWDDDKYFTDNPAMRSVDGLKQIWSSLLVSRFVPLTLTSFWVERRVWGLNPLPYHAVNVALQAVSAVLLWRLLDRLRVRGAWVAAAVWAVHTVNVETVAWATELKNTQSGLFCLLALWSLLRFEDGGRRRDYVMALICGALAMLSKSSTVVLPAVMLLCVWWRRGRWIRNDVWRVAPFVVFAVGMSLWTIVEQHSEIVVRGRVSEFALTVPQRLLIAGRAPWFYLGKVFWPVNLCFVYPRWELPVPVVTAWLPLVGLAILAGALWRLRSMKWARATVFALGYFIIALLPVLGFFDTYYFRYTFVADHFQYLASIGPIALVISVCAWLCQRSGSSRRYVGAFGATALLLLLGISTWVRCAVYHDSLSLWQDTVARNPGCWMAHNNLGSALAGAGRGPEAIAQYEQSLRIKPDHAEAYVNLGVAMAETGRLSEAINCFKQALQFKPGFFEAHLNCGVALAQAGQFPEAIAHYEEALRIKPDDAEARNDLAVALEKDGRIQEAVTQYKEALRIQPDYATARANLQRLGAVP